MKRILSAAVMIAMLSTAAIAETATPEAVPPVAAPKKTSNLDKVRCRMEAPIGSIIPKRVCTTQRAEQVQRTQVEQFMDRPTPQNGNN